MMNVIQSVIGGQYGAAFAMMGGCVERADESAWLAAVGKFPFWQVAYHALFSTDMYLSSSREAFRPPVFHVEGYNWLGAPPWKPDMKIAIGQPYDKQLLADYVGTCRGTAKHAVAAETEASLRGPSGFPWLQFTRLELHLYNLRHLQHHVGQLSAALRRQPGGGMRWVISQPL